MKNEMKKLEQEYAECLNRIATFKLLSHGYVQDRGPGAGGPCYQWTRKEKGKTVSVAMSKEQYGAMLQATQNWKEVKLILKRMEQISRTIIFKTLKDTRRSKPLTDEVLGLN